MRAKGYFGVLVTVLLLLGWQQEPLTVPNQQIVVKFTEGLATSAETQNAITAIKEQLKALGISNIQVAKTSDGLLNISYYSAANIESIKRVFSADTNLALGFSNSEKDSKSFPLEKNTNTYNLNVYEIQNGIDVTSNVNGLSTLELNEEFERASSHPNVFFITNDTDQEDCNNRIKVAYKLHRTIAIAIDNTAYKIPDVRAGPYTKGNS